MKALALILLTLVVACMNCTHVKVIQVPPDCPACSDDKHIDARLPFALVGRTGYAHSCPVMTNENGTGIILTAFHVLYREVVSPITGEVFLVERFYFIEDAEGNVGHAKPLDNHRYADIAALSTDLEVREYYPIGARPSVGDDIYWYEYDFSKPEKAFAPRKREGEVVNTRVYHVVFDETPVAGASGTCVFNSDSEVIGILVRGRGLDDFNVVGIAVGMDAL